MKSLHKLSKFGLVMLASFAFFIYSCDEKSQNVTPVEIDAEMSKSKKSD